MKLELSSEEARVLLAALEQEGYRAAGVALHHGRDDSKARVAWRLFERVEKLCSRLPAGEATGE